MDGDHFFMYGTILSAICRILLNPNSISTLGTKIKQMCNFLPQSLDEELYFHFTCLCLLSTLLSYFVVVSSLFSCKLYESIKWSVLYHSAFKVSLHSATSLSPACQVIQVRNGNLLNDIVIVTRGTEVDTFCILWKHLLVGLGYRMCCVEGGIEDDSYVLTSSCCLLGGCVHLGQKHKSGSLFFF